jgi:putative peptidoglycan binding protein
MRNKLLIGMALLAAGIAVASCEKTPSGEPGAETQNQSGSARSERQDQAQQPAGQKPDTQQQRSEAQRQPDQSASQTAHGENEQETKQVQLAQQNQPNSNRDALQHKQEQPNQPQQSQVQQSEPQQNQPPQNQQNGNGTAGRTLNLSREQIRQAQSVLKQKGFDVGVIDGILGPATRKALIAFQEQQGLQANGQMDQRTVTALGIAGSITASQGGAKRP